MAQNIVNYLFFVCLFRELLNLVKHFAHNHAVADCKVHRPGAWLRCRRNRGCSWGGPARCEHHSEPRSFLLPSAGASCCRRLPGEALLPGSNYVSIVRHGHLYTATLQQQCVKSKTIGYARKTNYSVVHNDVTWYHITSIHPSHCYSYSSSVVFLTYCTLPKLLTRTIIWILHSAAVVSYILLAI